MTIRILISFLALIVLSSCNYFNPSGLKNISSAELYQLMKSRDIFLVEVHIPEQRHIKGTDLFVPFNEISKNLHKFPSDKGTEIYLYCEGSPMARSAARDLIEAGYQNLYNLEGGIIQWTVEGFPLEPSPKK